MFNTADLQLDRWIVHDVPRRGSGVPVGEGVVLSDAVSPASNSVANFLQRRVSNALGKSAREVEETAPGGSPLPGLVRDVFAGSVELVDASKMMAAHLHACQTGSVSPGLLVVAEATLAARKALVIVKLEPQDGARARQRTTPDGKSVMEIEVLDDLVLTRGTRVFKVAVFDSGEASGTPVVGWAVDPQNDQGGIGLADFFLTRFLGCGYRDQPDELTRRFVVATEEWISQHVTDPSAQADYAVALQTELKSNKTTLRVSDFAATYLKPEHRDAFRERLRETNVPSGPVTKDLGLVQNKLAKVQWTFEQGTMVLAPTDQIGETVTTETLADGRAVVQVRDKVTGVRGRRRS